jgi:cardiolipin synthase C
MINIRQNCSAIANRSVAISGMLKACCSILLIGFVSAGCATVPKEYPRNPSIAITVYTGTGLDQLFEEAAAQHPGESGFAIIRHGRQAFTDRVALTELAEKSLDLQYYIWERDETGRILAERLVRAADRGVRVRVLVDDINLSGQDAPIAALDAHPNIEIRIFNPFANRGARLFDSVIDLDRVNHRMHNKILVADNAVAIVGGRNIGNHYFEVATDANFRDLDIAAAGPVVRDISGVFDYFWNSDWAVREPGAGHTGRGIHGRGRAPGEQLPGAARRERESGLGDPCERDGGSLPSGSGDRLLGPFYVGFHPAAAG